MTSGAVTLLMWSHMRSLRQWFLKENGQEAHGLPGKLLPPSLTKLNRKFLAQASSHHPFHWFSDADELKVKEETGATIRCFPFEQPEGQKKCFMTGNPAQEVAIFAKSYWQAWLILKKVCLHISSLPAVDLWSHLFFPLSAF